MHQKNEEVLFAPYSTITDNIDFQDSPMAYIDMLIIDEFDSVAFSREYD